MDKYFLIGSPIQHSLSPKMHRIFAKKYNQNMQFNIIQCNKNNIHSIMSSLIQDTYVRGLSITTPLKEEILKYCHYYDQSAKICNSVSNIIFDRNRKVFGFNLDGIGFLNDILNNLKINLHNKKILIIGAGPTARSICYSILLYVKSSSITIINRSYDKALKILSKLGIYSLNTNFQCKRHIKYFNNYDFIINATSCNLNKINFINIKLSQHNDYYEVIYNKNIYCEYNTGIGMLLEINKIIFSLWRGIKIKDYLSL